MSRFRFRTFRRAIAAAEVVSIWTVSFFPVNMLRVLILRFWGARIGKGVAIHHGLQVRKARRLEIGDDVFIGEDVVLDARGGLVIGSHTSINSRVMIWSAQHDWRAQGFDYVERGVVIGRHCWINAASIVIPGRSIGDGAVVGAGSVVSSDVEEWVVVGGNPIQVLRQRPRDLEYELEAARNKIMVW